VAPTGGSNSGTSMGVRDAFFFSSQLLREKWETAKTKQSKKTRRTMGKPPAQVLVKCSSNNTLSLGATEYIFVLLW